MPLDAVCLSAVVNELEDSLLFAKIDKIQMPERDEIILGLRTNRNTSKLLISAGTGDSRIHTTSLNYENPQTPPMFCMLLRKHLTGAIIEKIEQIPDERAVFLVLNAVNSLGDRTKKTLVCEFLGKYSNIILLDSDDTIIDSLKRVDITMSEKRQILPGLKYRIPPRQNKVSVFETPDFDNSLNQRGDKWLMETFCGISPLAAREVNYSSFKETDAIVTNPCILKESWLNFLNNTIEKHFVPVMLVESDGKPKDFYCFKINQYGSLLKTEVFNSFSELLDFFYEKKAKHERIKQKTQILTKQIKNARDRIIRKVAIQNEELKDTFNRERFRQFGDIISANYHLISRGDTILRALDFYDPEGKECEIPLDPSRNPQQNAARYYKEYSKAKNAERVLTEQIIIGNDEIEYLNSVLDELERAEGEKDIQEIKAELESTGYVKKQKNGPKDKPVKFLPLNYISSSGMEIRVGRNNTQNDTLTLKNSSKTDLWFHAQKIHGSHVVVTTNGEAADEKTVYEAACLAVLHSKASEGVNIPVDYTLVKYVKKPSGAKPGMVIYTNFKTIVVTPDHKLEKTLAVK